MQRIKFAADHHHPILAHLAVGGAGINTLLGGDTTSTPGPISLSLTAIGHVAPGQAVVLYRQGQDGDVVLGGGTAA